MESINAKRYDQTMWLLERLSLVRLRRDLLSGVHGEVLEIGVGTGANLSLYAPGTYVTAVDIEPKRLTGATRKATRDDVDPAVHISCANAHDLPFPDDRFDFVVSTLVFCSIPQPDLALAEIKRVLRPHGRLLMLEHVRGQNFVTRRLTDWLHPLWFALQGECHLNRETAVTVREAGFALEETETHGMGVLQMIKARPLPATAGK